jgi:glycosyltransferase involved in cell wall biosynthesis
LDIFVELSKRLDKHKYQIVLVGTNEQVDKQLPDSIISIHKTHNQKELAEIYANADVLLNPTREDNFPTVNLEALACGTPVITFETGGSPECIDDSCGCVVPCDDVDAMEEQINKLFENFKFNKEDCINRAKKFDMNDRFAEYVEMYK